MSYHHTDSAAFRRDLDAWITRGPHDSFDGPDGTEDGEEPECVCERTGCPETHDDSEQARREGWIIVHTDDVDIVLCPGCAKKQEEAGKADAGDEVPW